MQEPLHVTLSFFQAQLGRSPLPFTIFPATIPIEASIEAIPMTTAQIMTFVFSKHSKIKTLQKPSFWKCPDFLTPIFLRVSKK